MTRPGLRRWWGVGVYFGTALGVLTLAFWPFNRTAREQSLRSKRLGRELEAQIALIESVPRQLTDLEALKAKLHRFKSELAGTHEVDLVMSRLRQRAESAQLELWTLNPSVPVLIQMDAGSDSLARLDLAVLPVTFECRGSFANVSHFLAQAEARADFCGWTSLSMTADPGSAGVSAKAEIRMFLLPSRAVTEEHS